MADLPQAQRKPRRGSFRRQGGCSRSIQNKNQYSTKNVTKIMLWVNFGGYDWIQTLNPGRGDHKRDSQKGEFRACTGTV
jgi:hypothetical protein